MKLFRLATLCCLANLLGLGAGCARQDIPAGQARAVTCMACHGGNGMATAPSMPHLTGQSRLYLGKQMRDFRDGRRSDPVMSPLATALTDEQIDNLAIYFESLGPCGERRD
jgi:cytochrome c553